MNRIVGMCLPPRFDNPRLGGAISRCNDYFDLGAIGVPPEPVMAADFLTLADRVARRIVAGELPPGTRLPTHRAFARQHGVAASTATRVYLELTRRGLIVGEVGR